MPQNYTFNASTSVTATYIGTHGVNTQAGNAPTFSKTSTTNFRVTFNAGGNTYASKYYIRAIYIGA